MTHCVRQAVIPAAGLGTRFLPVTKCVPKELIPLVDKPCLQHVVEEAVAAGVEEIIFVISRDKTEIRDYFSPQKHLDDWLRRRGQTDLAEGLSRIENMAQFKFVFQDDPLGLGHAVLCAREHIVDDNFFVILPDDVIDAEVPVCRQMLDVFNEQNGENGVIVVMPVEWDQVSRYGIVQATPVSDRVGKIAAIVEKPERSVAPSNLAVIGRYLLPKNIFAHLEKVTPGAGGEIQLTDALRTLISADGLSSYSFIGERYDTGTPEGWHLANLSLALKDPRLRDAMARSVKMHAAVL